MMDPEPGRCRRTDGKKWRCSRSVVADQKYCERHMHRGRQRSRKLVEGSENVLESDFPKANTKSSSPSVSSTKNINSNNKINISTPIGSRLSYPAPKTSKSAPTAVNVTSTSSTSEKKAINNNIVNLSGTPATIISRNSNDKGNCNFRVEMYNANSSSTISSSTKAAFANNETRNRSNYINGKGVDFNHNKVRVISCTNHGREGCPGGFSGPVYGLSPKSVLQGVIDAKHSLSGFGNKNVTETEPQRCRRTDGKKWKCSRSVVHGQKYCETHMHRGVKKVAKIPNLTTVGPVAPSTRSDNPFLIARRVSNGVNLNTDPSTSIAACPLPMIEDDSTTSSTSDATTITD